MTSKTVSNRDGFTLIELLIAMVVTAILGGALLGFMLAQSRFLSYQDALKDARSSSRAGLNILQSDLRMVETEGGVIAASSDSVKVRSPYGWGVICSADADSVVASIMPVDAFMLTTTQYAGYGWRGIGGSYTYVDGTGTPDITTTVHANCVAEGITFPSGGRSMVVTPGDSNATSGDPIFLHQVITYRLDNSTALPGRTALFRNIDSAGTNVSQEVVTPFDATSRFRFYLVGSSTAQDAVPGTLDSLRGLELVLNGASQVTPAGRGSPTRFDLTTAVFFKNRRD